MKKKPPTPPTDESSSTSKADTAKSKKKGQRDPARAEGPIDPGDVSESGMRSLTSVMMSGCLPSLQHLLLHGQPQFGDAALGHLTEALLNGACGRLQTIFLEGHGASDAIVKMLCTVTKARGITCDLAQIEEGGE